MKVNGCLAADLLGFVQVDGDAYLQVTRYQHCDVALAYLRDHCMAVNVLNISLPCILQIV
jgi:hypothetical protein